MQPQDIQLPRVAGSPTLDAPLEQHMIAGLVFRVRPGRPRADTKPPMLARLGARVRTAARYAMASDENRARMIGERRLQEANRAVGSLLEKSAATGLKGRAAAKARTGLERLHRAASAKEWNTQPERVLQSIARAHVGQLDMHALFKLRTGLLKNDPNDRELLLADIRRPEDRTQARQTLQALRQAVDDICARNAVQSPLESLSQMPGMSGQGALAQVMQVDFQLGRLRDRMNLLLDTSTQVRADTAGDDACHVLRARFLSPAAGSLKSNDLFRLHGLLEKYLSRSLVCASPATPQDPGRRVSFSEHRPSLHRDSAYHERPLSSLHDFNDEVPQELAPGLLDDDDHYDAPDERVYENPPESLYLKAENRTSGLHKAAIAIAMARRHARSVHSLHTVGGPATLRSRTLSRTPSVAPSIAPSYAPGTIQAVEYADTARALKAAVAAELQARGHTA
jgi:hypothetical protein